MIIHMVDRKFMLHTLCGQTHSRIFDNNETWSFEENDINCETCLYLMKTAKRNTMY